MGVRVDPEKCVGCGACVSACPEGFELKDGKSVVKDAEAPCVDQAVSVCPMGAIIKE